MFFVFIKLPVYCITETRPKPLSALECHEPTQRGSLASRLTGVQAGANNHLTGSECSRSIYARSNGETNVALSARDSLTC